MPNGHHVLRRRGKRLARRGSIQSDGIGHDKRLSGHLCFEIADREVGELPLVVQVEGRGTVEGACGSYAHIVGSE